MQLHVKSGDLVKVIAGDERGKTGTIKSVNRSTQRVIIEGLNLVTKHNKPSAKNPQGGITKIESPMHVFQREEALTRPTLNSLRQWLD
ncbi:MAG: 50S ribosomal protein L24 [Hymenobacter sp.]